MKKSLYIGLILVLMLGVILPASPAAAGKPVDFNASGTVLEIDEGTVVPAGESGRWRVSMRQIDGIVAGSINDAFTLTYKANVDELQAGNFHGEITFATEDIVIKVNGSSAAIVPDPVYGLPRIDISGHWSVKGGRGNGTFGGSILFVPVWDEYGNMHIDYVVPTLSSFTMEGKW